MGNFYTNITLRGPNQEAAAAALKGRRALVSPVSQGCILVFDEESEIQSEVVFRLAAKLSRQFACPALAVLNHDDDVLMYHLYERGAQRDMYDSLPGFAGGDPHAPPKGGDADILCSAFGSTRVNEVSRILRAPNETYTFALDRHADLLAALGLPDWGAGSGFNYLSEGEFPDGLDESALLTTE